MLIIIYSKTGNAFLNNIILLLSGTEIYRNSGCRNDKEIVYSQSAERHWQHGLCGLSSDHGGWYWWRAYTNGFWPWQCSWDSLIQLHHLIDQTVSPCQNGVYVTIVRLCHRKLRTYVAKKRNVSQRNRFMKLCIDPDVL